MSLNDTFYPVETEDVALIAIGSDGGVPYAYIDDADDVAVGDYLNSGENYDGILHSALLFRSCSIKKDSTIQTAILRFYITNDWDPSFGCTFRVHVDTNPDSGPLEDIEDYYLRVLSEDYIEESLLDEELEWIEIDIASVIQGLVNNPTWVSGNSINVFMITQPSSYVGDFDADTYIDKAVNIPELVVTWDEPTLPAPVLPSIRHFLGSRLETFKYELFTLENGIYKTSGLLSTVEKGSGVIDLDFSNDIIGSLSLSLIAGYNDINYASDLIRPIFSVNGNEYPMGLYFLTRPEDKNFKSYVDNTIKGSSLLLALEQDLLDVSYTAAKGSNVIALVTGLLDSVGAWLQYEIEASEEVLSEDMSYELGRSKLFVINSLLNTINYYPLWSNGFGVIKAQPWQDNPNIIWTFEDNVEGLYLSEFKRVQDYVGNYNKVILIANQVEQDTEPFISTLTLEDIGLEAHPLSYTNIQRYKTQKFDSEASSQEYLDLRAKRELLKTLEENETIDFVHGFVSIRPDGLPYHGDSYKFINKSNVGVYRIEKQKIPLKAGSLVSTTMRMVRSDFIE